MLAQVTNRRRRKHALADLLRRKLAPSFAQAIDKGWHDSGGTSCRRGDDEVAAPVFLGPRQGVGRQDADSAVRLVRVILARL